MLIPQTSLHYTFNPSPPKENCMICFEQFDNKDVRAIGHQITTSTSNQAFTLGHFVCQKDLQYWCIQQINHFQHPTCIICREPINIDTVFSSQEDRVIIKKIVYKQLLYSLKTGAIAGAINVALTTMYLSNTSLKVRLLFSIILPLPIIIITAFILNSMHRRAHINSIRVFKECSVLGGLQGMLVHPTMQLPAAFVSIYLNNQLDANYPTYELFRTTIFNISAIWIGRLLLRRQSFKLNLMYGTIAGIHISYKLFKHNAPSYL